MFSMHLERSMFRSYDIRGLYSVEQLNEYSIYWIGRGLGALFQKRKVDVCITGCDAREYAERMKESLIRGLTDSGIRVIDIGMATTPMGYFAQYHCKVGGLAFVTASHNPNGWCGIKLSSSLGDSFVESDLQELYSIIADGKWVDGKGKVEKKEIGKEYAAYTLSRQQEKKPLKIVANCRHGIAGRFAPAILRQAGHTVIEQFCRVDYSYPRGDANPSLDAMMEELGAEVRAQKADVGFAFDADGDRLGVVDENGTIIYPDRTLLLLARPLLEKKKGAVVYDVKCSQVVEDVVKAHGGKPVMCRTGYSFIKQKMKETGAVIAGERSGHFFIRESHYGYDDAILAAIRLADTIIQSGKPLSSLVSSLPRYYTSPVYHAPCPSDQVKQEIMGKLAASLIAKYPQAIDIDGVRIPFDDGWGLVRVSSNLPVLVVVVEGRTPAALVRIEWLFRQELAAYPEVGEWHNG